MQTALPQVGSKDDSQRNQRLRDNKRRHRRRQKDHTVSLETRLRELEAKGVQATQEVQISARKVVDDNQRLKALLRHLGVCDIMIESWTPNNLIQSFSEGPNRETESFGIRVREDPQPNMECTRIPPDTIRHTLELSIPLSEQPSIIPEPGVNNSTGNEGDMASNDESTTQGTKKTQGLPPCKVLTRLAENPGLDITQHIAAGDGPSGQESGGVECSKAHDMLMQFATTEAKLDVISQALEQSCVAKSGGGCKVRNEALWKVIDKVT